MTATLKLPTTSFGDRPTDALARDMNGVLLRMGPPRRFVTVVQQYREPMYLAIVDQPIAIYAARIREADAPEAVVAHGTRVSFTWAGSRGARIDGIEGMTPGATRYVFDFEVVG